jgi:hypothetical protein
VEALDDVVCAVCRLPVDFYTIGTLSAVDLVEQSGYLGRRADVTVSRLIDCLEAHSDWVHAWFGWSLDNRSMPAWWIGGVGADRYEVGYSEAPGPSAGPPLQIKGKVRACAEYVKRELEHLADIAERPASDEQRLWRDLRRREKSAGPRPSSRDIAER